MTVYSTENRQQWMSVLARATHDELEKAWSALVPTPEYSLLRPAQTGLVMVQACANGNGEPFNMGEMTVTRCAVSMGPTVGHAYVAGRDRRHAELAAVFDGLLQQSGAEALQKTLISQLAARQQADRQKASAEAAATKVDFFTMVRGEDQS